MKLIERSDVPHLPGESGTALRTAASSLAAETLELAARIAEVPAPTHAEYRRTRLLTKLMTNYGFSGVNADDIGNVTGRIEGRDDARELLIAAHIDTVFPEEIDVRVAEEPGRLIGPGIGDNSIGVAAAVMLPKLLKQAGISPDCTWVVTGNVGEEGLGNLRGMIRVLDDHPNTRAVIALEGHNLGRITHVAVGSRRFRVTVEGPGGHSWGDSENPSAIHESARLISRLLDIDLPDRPRTTMNVGTIDGGISVNTIAPTSSFLLDIRSVDESTLARITNEVEQLFQDPSHGVLIRYELMGTRPAGAIDRNHRILRVAYGVLQAMGINPIGDASSTDANIPISRGLPAVCIGLTEGGNAHCEDEYILTRPVTDGLYQLLALAVSVSADVAADRM